MTSSANTEDQLLKFLSNYGLTGTSAATQILSAWRTWDDIMGDIASFNKELSRYHDVCKLMNTFKNNQNMLLNNIDKEIVQQQQREGMHNYLSRFNPFCDKSDYIDEKSVEQLLDDKKKLQDEFDALKLKFGDEKNIEQHKDELLQRSQIFEILALVATWIDIFQGWHELKNNTKELGQCKQELQRIELEYIQPIFQIWKETCTIDEVKMGGAMLEMRILKRDIEKQKEIAKQSAIKHTVGTISNGFAVASSIAKIAALGTGSFSSMAQWGIGFFQGAAVASHATIAFWAGQNYYEFVELENQINKKYERLCELKNEMHSLSKKKTM